MGIKQFFHVYEDDEFTEQFTIDMDFARQEVNSALMYSDKNGGYGVTPPVDSLVELCQDYLAIFEDTFDPLMDPGKTRVRRTYSFFASPEFQAIWLKDGGDKVKAMSLNLWSDLVEDLCKVGVHQWFYQMPFKDSQRAFGVMVGLIKFLTDSEMAKDNFNWIATPAWEPEALRSVMNFTGGLDLEGADDKNLDDLIGPYFDLERGANSPSIDRVLRECVYNEALRLKARGHPVHQVVNRLSNRIAMIFDRATAPKPELPTGELYPLFHRQVLINALAPFPEDMAYLDVSGGEMYGHHHIHAKPHEKALVPHLRRHSLINNLLPVFCGPAFISNANNSKFTPFHIALSLEDKGVDIDLDAILTGHIKSLSFLMKVVQYKGHSQELERLFAEYPTLQHKTTVKANRVVEYASMVPSPYPFSEPAKIGYAVALIESARHSIKNSGAIAKQRGPDRLVQDDKAIDEAVLDYLRATGPLDHQLLQWCGYTSDVLVRLTDAEQEQIAEHYLGEDLGL